MNYNDLKPKIEFLSLISHISSTQQPHVTTCYHGGQKEQRFLLESGPEDTQA